MPSSTSPSSSEGDLPVDVEKHADPLPADHQAPHQSKEDGEPNDASPTEPADDWQISPEPEPDILNTDADGMAGAVSRVLSRISTKSSWNPGPPPDGGKVAWLACKSRLPLLIHELL